MTNCAWIDIETTGLDQFNDRILEVGMVVTSPGPEFKPLSYDNWVFPYIGNDFTEAALEPVVLEMHNANDLWNECLEAYQGFVDPKQLEQQMIRFLADWGADDSYWHGNGVHFDKMFIQRHLPVLYEQFHYRIFDVSTLKQYALMFNKEYPWIDRAIHRGVPDCQDAIANAIHFRNVFTPTWPTDRAK